MTRYLLILSISLFSIICEKIEIWANNYFYLYEMKDDETIFQIEVDEPKDNEKMKVEFFLSHPSSYQILINYTDEKEKEEKEKEKEEKEEEQEEKEEEQEEKEEKEKEEKEQEKEEKEKEKEQEEKEEEQEEKEKEEK